MNVQTLTCSFRNLVSGDVEEIPDTASARERFFENRDPRVWEEVAPGAVAGALEMTQLNWGQA